ncbi:polyprenyl synthetase family protein [Candidatus Bipolaricaulota bacterium]|nr:polyprenyl synthetase family protein [Candidatus Bipolaricaulota bacterium]HHR85120.1 polyprenyl synthetase family protein [Candidatus Acetothermia bacterium]
MRIPQILMLYGDILEKGLQEALSDPISADGSSHDAGPLYPTLRYHVGLCDERGRPVKALGKMLRPSLLLFTAQELGADMESALPAAIALELVHNFSLIHDDIQDHDELRRGRPTVWKLIGVAQAINAGDLMYSIATRKALLAGADAAGVIIDAATTMIEGQGLDLAFEDRWINVQSYIDMIDKKTGALVCCAFRAAGIIARTEQATIDLLTSLGMALGRAFQIRDDLLGIWGDGDLTGKLQGSDIRRKKKSFPVALITQETNEEGKALLESVYAQERISDDDVARVIALMGSLDVKERGEAVVEGHLKEAREHLERLPLSKKGKELMDELIVYLARREK